MESGALKLLDPDLYRRGQRITTGARWVSVGLGGLALLLVWNSPRLRLGPFLVAAGVFLALTLVNHTWSRRRPASRAVRRVQAVADGVALGLGAAYSGGLESPLWLMFYPHVVACSVRGGLAFALAIGALDGAMVLGLTWLTPQQPFGGLHALGLIWCAVLGGVTSSYL